jgi:hypothetical protein
MKIEELNKILEPVGTTMGLENLMVDADGTLTLLGEGIETLIETDEDGDSVFITSMLGASPPAGATDLLEKMLYANFYGHQTAGASLGMDRNLNMVVLCLRLSDAEIRADESLLSQRFVTFLEAAEYWAFMISEQGQHVSSKEATDLSQLHSSAYRA